MYTVNMLHAVFEMYIMCGYPGTLSTCYMYIESTFTCYMNTSHMLHVYTKHT